MRAWRGFLAASLLLAVVTPSVAATIEQLRKMFGEGGATDAQVIQRASASFKISPDEIAREVGYTGSLVNVRINAAQPDSTDPVAMGQRPNESFADRLSEKAVGGAVLGGAFGLLCTLIAAARKYLPRMRVAAKRSAVSSVATFASGVASAKLTIVHANSRAHDSLYEQAMAELDESRQEKAAWARALVSVDGDERRAKAHYIRLRVAQLDSTTQ